MSIVVDGRTEALIRQKVEDGQYPDAASVVREALRLLEERDSLRGLRADLQKGLDQIVRGEVTEFTDELLDQLAREAEQNARDGKPIRDAVKP